MNLHQAEARLHEQVIAGNQAVLGQMRSMQSSTLPQLLATVKQQMLELQCAQDAEEEDWDTLPEDGGFARAKAKYLKEKAAEAGEEVRSALDKTSGALEGQDPALVAMLAELCKAQPAQRDDSSAVLAKLDGLMMRMDAMGQQFGALHAKVDHISAAQANAFNALAVKMDQLLLNEHEQIFTHFIMKPLPSKKTGMGKVLARMNPKKWFVNPMLLVPLYKDQYGQLLEAPVANKHKGFKVSKPTEFVLKHPRMVQLGMLALKIGIKIAAAQLAVNVPAEALDALGPKTDGLINEMLTMSCESMKEHFEDDDNLEEFYEKMDDVLASTFDAPNDAPDEALEELMGNDKFKEMSKREYAQFTQWMDGAHPDWRNECGLVSEINPATGRAEHVPPGMYSGN